MACTSPWRDYGNLSERAIGICSPHMENGMNYYEAATAGWVRPRNGGSRLTATYGFLPYYGEWLKAIGRW